MSREQLDREHPLTATFLSFSFGSKVADLLEIVGDITANPKSGSSSGPKTSISNARLKLQGHDDRQDDHQKVVPELEPDCSHNDSKVFARELTLHGFQFVSTVLSCKNTKYGLSYLHVGLHMPACRWTRWATTTARRFYSSVGVNS